MVKKITILKKNVGYCTFQAASKTETVFLNIVKSIQDTLRVLYWLMVRNMYHKETDTFAGRSMRLLNYLEIWPTLQQNIAWI